MRDYYCIPSYFDIDEAGAKRIAYMRLNTTENPTFPKFIKFALQYQGICWKDISAVEIFKTWDELGFNFSEDEEDQYEDTYP